LLAEQLQKARRAKPIVLAPRFDKDSLVLGSGTVLAKGVSTADDEDARLKALLTVAYGAAEACEALGHVKAATARWREGDKSRAELHLALSGLGRLECSAEAARRLFLADALLSRGASPDAILAALDPGAPPASALLKYSPDQPRVPAGGGRPSGQWTAEGASAPAPASASPPPKRPPAPPQTARPVPAAVPPPRSTQARTVSQARSRQQNRPSVAANPGTAPQIRSRLAPSPPASRTSFDTATAIAVAAASRAAPALDLGAWPAQAATAAAQLLLRAGSVLFDGAPAVAAPAIAGFGLALIPNPIPQPQWVKIGGPGDVSYLLAPEETALHLRYTGRDGTEHTSIASLSPNGGDYKDPNGRSIARWVRIGAKVGLLVSTAALEEMANSDDPKLCPKPEPDRLGAREKDQDYEDYVKAIINPGAPTPRGLAYWFEKPGEPVAIDDCQHSTGALFEIKGTGFAEHFLKEGHPGDGMIEKILKQARSQLQGAKGRHLTWIFAEKYAADYVRDGFEGLDKGLEKITVLNWPPPESNKCFPYNTGFDPIGGLTQKRQPLSRRNSWKRSTVLDRSAPYWPTGS
jgi:hypothetical protein